MGPCRACAVSSTVSLCGKSAEATTKPIIETRDQEQQAPSPLYSYHRLLTALPRLLSWPGASHIHCREQELESLATKSATGERGREREERRSSLKENSGVHNPSLHLAQLRWRWGRSKQRASPPPPPGVQEGRRGMEIAHNGWLCL